MPICNQCGVQLDDQVLTCPLCGAGLGSITREIESKPLPQPSAANSDLAHARRVTWEVVSLSLATAAAVVFAADFAFNRATTWSAIPLASIGFLWLTGSTLILAGRRVQMILLLETLSLLLFLALVDRAIPGKSWFLLLAAPTTVLLGGLVSLILLVTRAARLSALSVVALSLLGTGLLLLGVETMLNYFLTQQLLVSWSMLTFACILPPVLMLLYLKHRLRKSGPEIRKLFHL